jgi:hypothetical protein
MCQMSVCVVLSQLMLIQVLLFRLMCRTLTTSRLRPAPHRTQVLFHVLCCLMSCLRILIVSCAAGPDQTSSSTTATGSSSYISVTLCSICQGSGVQTEIYNHRQLQVKPQLCQNDLHACHDLDPWRTGCSVPARRAMVKG